MRAIFVSGLVALAGCAASDDYIRHPPDYVLRTMHTSQDEARVNRVMAIVTGVAGTILTITGGVLVGKGGADKVADCASDAGFLCDLNGELEQNAGAVMLSAEIAHLLAGMILTTVASCQAGR